MTQDTPQTSDLIQQKCVPCEGGTMPFTDTKEDKYLTTIPDWKIDRSSVHQIKRELTYKNFVEVLEVVNNIGEIAEAEGHHPNLYIYGYKNLRIELYTHAIGGLSINDFIMAAKIDTMLENRKK